MRRCFSLCVILRIVWKKLEELEPEFMSYYYVRQRLKDQIIAFNYLVSQCAQKMLEMKKPLHEFLSSSKAQDQGSEEGSGEFFVSSASFEAIFSILFLSSLLTFA